MDMLVRDTLLAAAHFVLIFLMIGFLAAEWAMLLEPLESSALRRLGRVDLGYGIAAGALVVVGICRVLFGAKPSLFYTSNPVFWVKMAILLVLALVSILPTVRFIQWQKRALKNSTTPIPKDELRMVKLALHVQATLMILVPFVAAAMARGWGL
jgi:putative membrane protein